MKKNYNAQKKHPLIIAAWMFRCLLTALVPIAIGITGSGAVYAQAWVTVGAAGFSAGQADGTTIAMGANDTPYVVYEDWGTANKASVKKFNGSTWVNAGIPGFSAGTIGLNPYIAMNGSGTPYVVYSDGSILTGNATVMSFVGGSWANVGAAGFSANQAINTTIAIDAGTGIPYVAYQDAGNSNKATVMRFAGGSWGNLGMPGFSDSIAWYTSIAIGANDTAYVAYQDVGNSNKATVMKFNGTNWVPVGMAGFSAGAATYTSLAINSSGTPYVAFVDGSTSQMGATVMKYNGSSWVIVGNPWFSAGSAGSPSIAIDASGTPYVAFIDGHTSATGATVMRFNGTAWEDVGNAGFSAGEAGNTSIAIGSGGVPYVAYEDYSVSMKATVMKPGTWITGVKNVTNPTATSLSIYPNPNDGSFIITLSSGTNEDARITLTNILGEKVKECTIPANKQTAIQSDAPPGMYFLTAVTSTGTQSAKVAVR